MTVSTRRNRGKRHKVRKENTWGDFLQILNNNFCSDPSLIRIANINHSRDISGVWTHLVGEVATLPS